MILKNLFFPPKCIFCRKVLPINQTHPNICKECEKYLPHLPVRTCIKCGKPMDAVYDKPYCPFCAGHIKGIRAIISPFLYKEELRESILHFKFHNRPYYAETYAFYLEARLRAYHLTKFDALVPIPVSKKRLRERGYDQCLMLANALSKRINIPVMCLLEKTLHTPKQSTLNKHDRQNHPKKAFQVKPQDEMPETILLIDDIYTTGATAGACAEKLRRAGVRNVYIATVAMHLPYLTNVEEDSPI